MLISERVRAILPVRASWAGMFLQDSMVEAMSSSKREVCAGRRTG
jgi:hypothetical protein